MKIKAVDLHVKWCKPLNLIDVSKKDMIYAIDGIDKYDNVPGVYMFCRKSADKLSPVYIGKSVNIALRTRQHLNEVKLMKKIYKMKDCEKVLIIGKFIKKSKQSIPRWIRFIEDILIKEAIENKADLINKQGTRIKKHRIRLSGYTGVNEIFGRLIHC